MNRPLNAFGTHPDGTFPKSSTKLIGDTLHTVVHGTLYKENTKQL
jgi:hypothetical protein